MGVQHILFHLDTLGMIISGRRSSSSSMGIDRAGLLRFAANQLPPLADPGPGGGGA